MIIMFQTNKIFKTNCTARNIYEFIFGLRYNMIKLGLDLSKNL